MPSSSSWRRRGLASTALFLTLTLWTLNFGLIDLIDGFTGFVDQSRNQVLDAGWGALFGIMLPLGLLAQIRRPERSIAGLQQTGVILVAIALAAVAATEWWYLALVAVLATAFGVLLVLHPARHAVGHRTGSFKVLLALLASVAAVPCLVYANRMASAQRRNLPPLDGETNGLHHWTAMAALGLAVVFLMLLAALGTEGWHIPAWSAALGATAWGFSCVAGSGPSAAASEGRNWGYAAIAWAIAVIAAVVSEARREPRSGESPSAGDGDALGRVTPEPYP
jgi:MFS family permease